MSLRLIYQLLLVQHHYGLKSEQLDLSFFLLIFKLNCFSSGFGSQIDLCSQITDYSVFSSPTDFARSFVLGVIIYCCSTTEFSKMARLESSRCSQIYS